MLQLVNEGVAGVVQLFQLGLAGWASFDVLGDYFEFGAGEEAVCEFAELICRWAKGLGHVRIIRNGVQTSIHHNSVALQSRVTGVRS